MRVNRPRSTSALFRHRIVGDFDLQHVISCSVIVSSFLKPSSSIINSTSTCQNHQYHHHHYHHYDHLHHHNHNILALSSREQVRLSLTSTSSSNWQLLLPWAGAATLPFAVTPATALPLPPNPMSSSSRPPPLMTISPRDYPAQLRHPRLPLSLNLLAPLIFNPSQSLSSPASMLPPQGKLERVKVINHEANGTNFIRCCVVPVGTRKQ